MDADNSDHTEVPINDGSPKLIINSVFSLSDQPHSSEQTHDSEPQDSFIDIDLCDSEEIGVNTDISKRISTAHSLAVVNPPTSHYVEFEESFEDFDIVLSPKHAKDERKNLTVKPRLVSSCDELNDDHDDVCEVSSNHTQTSDISENISSSPPEASDISVDGNSNSPQQSADISEDDSSLPRQTADTLPDSSAVGGHKAPEPVALPSDSISTSDAVNSQFVEPVALPSESISSSSAGNSHFVEPVAHPSESVSSSDAVDSHFVEPVALPSESVSSSSASNCQFVGHDDDSSGLPVISTVTSLSVESNDEGGDASQGTISSVTVDRLSDNGDVALTAPGSTVLPLPPLSPDSQEAVIPRLMKEMVDWVCDTEDMATVLVILLCNHGNRSLTLPRTC